jgi:hypothetical protein
MRTRYSEHSRVATMWPHDARKDWGGSAPFLDLPSKAQISPLRQLPAHL